MDGSRFDGFSKTFARRLSRRRALRDLGKGGLATLAAAAALDARSGLAQDATPDAEQPTRCLIFFDATVRQGPSNGLSLRGFLKLPAIEEGSFDDGSLIVLDPDGPDGVSTLNVGGQVSGRAINLMIRVAEDEIVYGVGTLGAPLSTCPDEMGGPFVGPVTGDFGDWASFLSTRPLIEPCAPNCPSPPNPFGSCDNCRIQASNMYNTGYSSQQVTAACTAAGGCP